jgi:hypothetical protein
MQIFLQARFIESPRGYAPPALRKTRDQMIISQSCQPATGTMAAFEFAEVGTFRWQLAAKLHQLSCRMLDLDVAFCQGSPSPSRAVPHIDVHGWRAIIFGQPCAHSLNSWPGAVSATSLGENRPPARVDNQGVRFHVPTVL